MVHPQGQAPRHRLLSQREVPTRAGQSATSLAVAGQSWDVGTGDDLSYLGMSDIFWLSWYPWRSLEIFGDLWRSLEIWGSECQDACHKVLRTTFSSLAAYQRLQVYIALQNLVSDIRSVIPLHLAWRNCSRLYLRPSSEATLPDTKLAAGRKGSDSCHGCHGSMWLPDLVFDGLCLPSGYLSWKIIYKWAIFHGYVK